MNEQTVEQTEQTASAWELLVRLRVLVEEHDRRPGVAGGDWADRLELLVRELVGVPRPDQDGEAPIRPNRVEYRGNRGDRGDDQDDRDDRTADDVLAGWTGEIERRLTAESDRRRRQRGVSRRKWDLLASGYVSDRLTDRADRLRRQLNTELTGRSSPWSR